MLLSVLPEARIAPEPWLTARDHTGPECALLLCTRFACFRSQAMIVPSSSPDSKCCPSVVNARLVTCTYPS